MTFQEFLEEWHNDLPYINAHTSGSTGKPKEIQLNKKFVEESAFRTIDFFKITDKSILYSCVSPDFIGGKMMAVRADLASARLLWEIPSNQALVSYAGEFDIDLLAVVPSQMESVIRNPNLKKIKNIIIGGAPLSPALKKKISEAQVNAFETYGMTETASHIALRKITQKEEPFVILPGIEIKANSFGCLVIKFKDGKEIETNDIVRIISDKEFFVIGRKDFVINSGAKKINPVELEEKISPILKSEFKNTSSINENDFCISSIPDEKWGERIVLVMKKEIIEGNDQEKTSKLLLTEMKKKLEHWCVPKDVVFLTKLPLTPNGKLQRSLISRFLASRYWSRRFSAK